MRNKNKNGHRTARMGIINKNKNRNKKQEQE